jgi:hypothetical protein
VHEVIFYAAGSILNTCGQYAEIVLHHKEGSELKNFHITMHRHHLEQNDLFSVGRWFDFRVVRVEGQVELELGRRPDLEDNVWVQQVKQLETRSGIRSVD